MELKEARALIKKWQKTFRLNHWTISVVRLPDESTPCGAEIQCQPFSRQAVIGIESQMRVDELNPARNTLEWAVVHEMVHMLLLPLRQVTAVIEGEALQDLMENAEEEIVWGLTDILCSL